MVDRFDVRNLLTDRNKFQKRAATVRLKKENIEIEALCDKERYRLLRDPDPESEAEEDRELYRGDLYPPHHPALLWAVLISTIVVFVLV